MPDPAAPTGTGVVQLVVYRTDHSAAQTVLTAMQLRGLLQQWMAAASCWSATDSVPTAAAGTPPALSPRGGAGRGYRMHTTLGRLTHTHGHTHRDDHWEPERAGETHTHPHGHGVDHKGGERDHDHPYAHAHSHLAAAPPPSSRAGAPAGAAQAMERWRWWRRRRPR